MCNSCKEKLNRNSKKAKGLNRRGKKCSKNDGKKQELPKCPNPKRQPAKAKKCLTRIEKIMLRIQPPIADRERYFHPEHVNCFLEESRRVYIKKPKCVDCPPDRRKTCTEDKKKRKVMVEHDAGEKDEGNNKANVKTNKDEVTENGKEEGLESGTTKQDGEHENKPEENRERSDQRNSKGRAKKNKTKKNKAKHKPEEEIVEDGDSEMSICSNDSEICLVGLGLNKEDKEKIEENRRRVHPPPDKGDHSVQSGEEAPEVSTQKVEDTGIKNYSDENNY